MGVAHVKLIMMNMGIFLRNNKINYSIVKINNNEKIIIAEKLIDKVLADCAITKYEIIESFSGSELKNRKLALTEELQNRISVNSTRPNQPVITRSDYLSKEQAKSAPESQTQQEFSFIPPFLRKK